MGQPDTSPAASDQQRVGENGDEASVRAILRLLHARANSTTLLTFNGAHIANAERHRHLRVANLNLELQTPTICTNSSRNCACEETEFRSARATRSNATATVLIGHLRGQAEVEGI
jgi:hypothetical protein